LTGVLLLPFCTAAVKLLSTKVLCERGTTQSCRLLIGEGGGNAVGDRVDVIE